MADETKAAGSRNRATPARPAVIARKESVRDRGGAGGRRPGRVVLRARAAASFSGARKFASSASRRSKTSTTRITAARRSSWRRAARSCRGA
jgi:hypothetical protein